jgi:hypothetical protein
VSKDFFTMVSGGVRDLKEPMGSRGHPVTNCMEAVQKEKGEGEGEGE